MHQADVEVVGAEFAAEAFEIGAHAGSIASPRFREDGDFVALHVLEGFGNVRMASVGVGGVEEAQAMVVSVKQEIGEAFHAERGLVRMMSGADCAGAHGKAAGLDAGAAEGDGVGGGEFCCESLLRECVQYRSG